MDITHLQALLSIIFHSLDTYLSNVISQLGMELLKVRIFTVYRYCCKYENCRALFITILSWFLPVFDVKNLHGLVFNNIAYVILHPSNLNKTFVFCYNNIKRTYRLRLVWWDLRNWPMDGLVKVLC